MKLGCYARVSTHDQHTLTLQRDAMAAYAQQRGWSMVHMVLVGTLQELHALGVGFISLHEALDFTTPTGRALAGMLAVFAEFEREILRERVKAGIAQARRHGKRHGRPPRIAHYAGDVQRLYAAGLSKSAIARQLGIGRTSVRRFLGAVVSRAHTRRGEEST